MKRSEQVRAFRTRLAKVVEVGASNDPVSRAYDFFITAVIVVNLTAAVLSTFSDIRNAWGGLLDALEGITVALFALDYLLRLIAARYIYHKPTELEGLLAYVLSFGGIVDLLSFLPYYLPVFLPAGAAAFRIFRIVRIFRLFRINAYYDSLNAIAEVFIRKKQQLLSSVFLILVLLLGSSLCMYSVEHDAQPEVFDNAFSGIWWSVSTLLTVGYGDIYPITPLGKVLSIVITCLGVGMVAVPTGIISAGFVEQYARMQSSESIAQEIDIHFIKIRLEPEDAWVDQPVAELRLPRGVILTAIHRGTEVLIPRGDVVLHAYDMVILGAEPLRDQQHVYLKELVLRKEHPWNGQLIRDLDISRQSVIIMVKRKTRVIIPNGNTRLREGDVVLIHTKQLIPGGVRVEL